MGGSRREDREKERERKGGGETVEQLHLPNHVVSPLSAGRMVITGRRQRNPDWGEKKKKKSGDTQTAGLPPLGPQHNRNANQPIL